MTIPLLFLECCGIVLKILENSSSSAMDVKAGPVPEGERSSWQAEWSNSWPKGRSRNFYTLNSKRQPVATKYTKDISLLHSSNVNIMYWSNAEKNWFLRQKLMVTDDIIQILKNNLCLKNIRGLSSNNGWF